jgi:putative transposase
MARHWIFIAQTGNAHHWRDRPMGRPKTVNKQYLNRLKELVSNSPREYGYCFDRWTGQWLSKQLAKELGIMISACHVNRLLKQMGLSTRPKLTTEEVEERTNTNNSSLVIRDIATTAVSESLKIMWPIQFPQSRFQH